MKLSLTNTLAAALVVMATATTMVTAVPTSESDTAAAGDVAKRDRLSELTKGLDDEATVVGFHNWNNLWGGRLLTLLKRDRLFDLTKGLMDEMTAVGEATVDDFHKWTNMWGGRLKSIKRTNGLVHDHVVGPHEDDTATTAVGQASTSVSVSVSVSTVVTCTTDSPSAISPSGEPTMLVSENTPIDASTLSSSAAVPSSVIPTPETTNANFTIAVPTLISSGLNPTSSSDTDTSAVASASSSQSTPTTASTPPSSSLAPSSASLTSTSVPIATPSTAGAKGRAISAHTAFGVWCLWVVGLTVKC